MILAWDFIFQIQSQLESLSLQIPESFKMKLKQEAVENFPLPLGAHEMESTEPIV